MNIKFIAVALTAIGVAACASADELVKKDASLPEQTLSNTEVAEETTKTSADGVEIALVDKLDGVTSNYCIDIAGGNKDVDISNGLQAHTCYSYQAP